MMILICKYDERGLLKERIPLDQVLETKLASFFKDGEDVLELDHEILKTLNKHNVFPEGDCVLERWAK